ncbi:MAG: hypothetical protein KAS95_02665, partial [Candidatus Heimdallarchaeota archaeon]|nr:hypothetical protein [Candidatus Heimdallarchaeota archaeon]
LSSEELFELDPSNPTQILKSQFNEQKEIQEDESSTSDLSIDEIKLVSDKYEEVDFWIIEDFTVYPYVKIQVRATLLAIGNNSYVYVSNAKIAEKGLAITEDLAEDWRDEFESNIYPTEVHFFGNVDGILGDIDGDSHVTIFLTSLGGYVAGYFDPLNEFSGSTSNSREMIYVEYTQGFRVLAHEFQHLIHYNHDTDEHWWIDEGCAEFAAYITGTLAISNLTYFVEDYFVYNPEDALLNWNYDSVGGKDVRIDYGASYLFIFYIAEKYGYGAINYLVDEADDCAIGVEDALEQAGYFVDFNTVYLNWIVALTIDDPSFNDGLYGFINLDISIAVFDETSLYPYDLTGVMHRLYGFHILKLNSPPNYLMFEIEDSTTYSIGISVAVHDINGWHVKQEVQDGLIEIMVNGTSIDEAYIITSIVSATTPIILFDDQWGVGYTEYLDYSIDIGHPLFILDFDSNYITNNWSYTCGSIYIVDENGTEITDLSDIDVNIALIVSDTAEEYIRYALNYSSIYHWYGDLVLQELPEGDFMVKIIASGDYQYGVQNLGIITIQHTLEVFKPIVTMISVSSIQVTVSATYSQLYGWDTFTQNTEVMLILFSVVTDSVEATFDIAYKSSEDLWESNTTDLSSYLTGDYYVTISFKYAGRTVRSPNSDNFTIEGYTTENTSSASSYYLLGSLSIIALVSIILTRQKLKK